MSSDSGTVASTPQITSVMVPIRAVNGAHVGVVFALLFAAAVVGIGLNIGLLAYGVLAAWLSVVALYDVATKRIPNVLNAATAACTLPLLVFASAAQIDGTSIPRAALGAAIAFLGYLVLAVGVPSGIGLGDVKLSPIIGAHLAFLSWSVFTWGLIAAFFSFSVIGLGLLMTGRVSRTTRVPFGPFMVGAAFAAIAIGGPGF